MFRYGPSKNAIHGLTYVLNNEYDSVVRSETWLIGPVSTPAIGNMEPDGWFVVSSPSFAKRGVELFGFYEEYAPALGHAIQVEEQESEKRKIILFLFAERFDASVASTLEKHFHCQSKQRSL